MVFYPSALPLRLKGVLHGLWTHIPCSGLQPLPAFTRSSTQPWPAQARTEQRLIGACEADRCIHLEYITFMRPEMCLEGELLL